MKRLVSFRGLCWCLALGFVCFILLVAASDAAFGFLTKRLPDLTVKVVGKSLQRFHDICFYVSFDEPVPVSWSASPELNVNNTFSVDGPIGKARRFSGREDSYLETSVTWASLGTRYSMALWIRPAQTHFMQYVWACSGRTWQEGFILQNGKLEFHVPDGENLQMLAVPLEPGDDFIHVAVTVDAQAGSAQLFINGDLRDQIAITNVQHVGQNMEFGKERWYHSPFPFQGDLDEAVAWTRVLTGKEIARLATTRQGILPAKAPLAFAAARLATALSDGIRKGFRLMDHVNPTLHEGLAFSKEWPVIDLQLSKKDLRHFVREHEESLRSGVCTRSGVAPRGISVQSPSGTHRGELALDGIGSIYSNSHRPSYRLSVPPESPVLGETHLRLIAPERLENDFRWLNPSRSGTNGFCRLLINGNYKGMYYFESLNGFGVQLHPGGVEEVRNRVKRNTGEWPWIFSRDENKMFESPIYLPPEELEKRVRKVARLLASDVQHPWSTREWKWRIRVVQKRNENYGSLHAEGILGKNPAALFVVTDLDLEVAERLWGVTEWQPSHPELLDETGRVNRPLDGEAVLVTLTALRGVGDPIALAFRVMPAQLPVPVLFVYFAEPLRKTQRTELSARIFDCDGRDYWLNGIRKHRTGVKYRGNTSFWNGHKKPLGLEFDEPHYLLNSTATRHLALMNGYKDTTRMKNKLSFDVFRQMGEESGMRRDAPLVQWCELFVNGTYDGVFEMMTRVDADLLDFPPKDIAPENQGILFGPVLFSEPKSMSSGQEIPSRLNVNVTPQIVALQEWYQQAPAAEFVEDFGRYFDLSNLIDFTLLLNFTENRDGLTSNYFLGKRPGNDTPFFFTPWDYDNTFLASDHFLVNPLGQRLRKEDPRFYLQLGARWAEVRATILSDERLDAKIQEMAGPLGNIMRWEHKQFPHWVSADYAQEVANFREKMHTRLATLDEKFANPPFVAPESE